MSQERFIYLLQQFKTNTLTVEELEEWSQLVSSEAYGSSIDSDIEATLLQAGPDPLWDVDTEKQTWENIRKVTALAPSLVSDPTDPHRSDPTNPHRSLRRVVAIVATGAAACVLLVWGLWQRSSRVAESPQMVTRSPNGAKTHLSLSDGTTVWLDANSILRYPKTFEGASREVSLDGEAYFEVTPNSSMPFKVSAGRQQIKVLGTSFDISSYFADTLSQTTLLRGSIVVAIDGDSLLLQPGQQAVTRKGNPRLLLRQVDTARITAWMQNNFSFENTPLHDAVQQLERWYGIHIECSADTDTIRVTGSIIRRNPLEEALKMLTYTSHLDYFINGNTVRLRKKAQ